MVKKIKYICNRLGISALRFTWLSEWLRHKNHEMIDLETTYMKLLVDNSDMLKNVWKL